MMLPRPAASMCGTTARDIRNTPTVLVSITIRHASGSASQNGSGSVMNRSLTNRIPRAALLTSTSMRPRERQRPLDEPLDVAGHRHVRLHRLDRSPAAQRLSAATASASARLRATLIIDVGPGARVAERDRRGRCRGRHRSRSPRGRVGRRSHSVTEYATPRRARARRQLGAICSGCQRRSQSSATRSVRSSGPPGQHALEDQRRRAAAIRCLRASGATESMWWRSSSRVHDESGRYPFPAQTSPGSRRSAIRLSVNAHRPPARSGRATCSRRRDRERDHVGRDRLEPRPRLAGVAA